MRYACLILVLALLALPAACLAETQEAGVSEAPAAKEKHVLVDRDKNGTIDGIDVYDEKDRLVRSGYDYNNDRVMDTWRSYDQNTGLPNVVQSDTFGEMN